MRQGSGQDSGDEYPEGHGHHVRYQDVRPEGESRLKATYEKLIGRLDPEDRKVYDAFYQPIIDEFYKKNPQGKELAEWKYQRYMRDYAKVLKSFDDNVGRYSTT